MNRLENLKFLFESVKLYKEKIFRVVFFEIFYSIKYRKSGNFIKPPDIYPCAFYFIYKIAKYVKQKKIKNLVDLGCGAGRLVNFLNDATDAKISGYEIDKEAFEIANNNKGKNVNIIHENILNIDFENKDFDCFVFSGALYREEHQKDFFTVVKKIVESKKNSNKQFYIIGVNLDGDPRHEAVPSNFIFEEIKLNLIKEVSASNLKKIKFFSN